MYGQRHAWHGEDAWLVCMAEGIFTYLLSVKISVTYVVINTSEHFQVLS